MTKLFSVTASVDASTSVQEVSKIFEGLQRLSDRGIIRYSLEPDRKRQRWPRVVTLKVRHRDGRSRELAIDLSDQADLLDLEVLVLVDVYFKRSFHPPALPPLSPGLGLKVRPFGLNNPAVGLSASMRLLGARCRTGRTLRELARDTKQLLALPSPVAFEAPPDAAAERLVLFQTRVWPGNEPDVMTINNERADLVRSLRSAFGPRFIGGLVPCPVAVEHFPDLLTNLPYSMRSYPQLVRQSLVCIYSRGLHNSVAFKMSEYLAASRCIVADAPQFPPAELLEGHNFLGFGSAEECIEKCELLLSDAARAQKMRSTNWQYYCEHVEPGAHLFRTLERAFDDGTRS